MSTALQAALARVVPSYMQAVKGERERQVVMAVLEALTGVLRSCRALTLQPPGRLAELCSVLKAVLQRKVSRAGFLGKRMCQASEEWIVRGYNSSSIYPSIPIERRGAGEPRLR
jgi:hypothetical protein